MPERLKIVVFAPLDQTARDFLARHDYDVVYTDDADPAALTRELANAHGAVASNLFPMDDALLARCPGLRVIGRVGVGVDNVDVEAATRRGVRVVNTPEPIIEPVAEHTLALMLALARRIVTGDRNVRSGRFRFPEDEPGAELRGKTLGLVGFGNTGKRVAAIAALGLGMRVLYHDVVAAPAEEERLGARKAPFDELLRESDWVSVHVSLNASTRQLFDERAFRAMKPTAHFINVSRGGVVDEDALVRALREGWIAGAGLDVFAVEPTPRRHPLWELDSVVLTPHRAGWSHEGRVGCSMVVEDVVRVLEGEEPKFPVNRLPS